MKKNNSKFENNKFRCLKKRILQHNINAKTPFV